VTVFVGDDWAEDHHDVHLMTSDGVRLEAKRLPEGVEGLARLHGLIAEHAGDPSEVVVGIETERGMWVQSLIDAGYQVYAINPLSAARYRERTNVSGAKSDAGDAKMLADLVRTDAHNHRQIAGDTEAVNGLKILTRTHQRLVWDRTRHLNRLRSDLREFFPAALIAFDDLSHSDALAMLAKAPNPAQAAKLSVTQIRAALKRGGRQRNLNSRAAAIQVALRAPQMTAPTAIAAAFATSTQSLAQIIDGLNTQIEVLEIELTREFEQHPDSDIYQSMPGLGPILGARVLAEFGDDPQRYDSAKARRNYAGTSPVTIASGRKRAVSARHVRNKRLYNAVDRWAFSSLRNSQGCRDFYDHRKALGDLHHQALRALGNRLVGYLHGSLRTRTHYDETTAWAHRQDTVAA